MYKLNCDDRILFSLIKKLWYRCTFLNDFRGKKVGNKYVPCFIKIEFVVIPCSYILEV